MLWFKWVLFALFVSSGVINLSHCRESYQPEKSSYWIYGLVAVLDTLVAIGIWVWL